MYLPLSMVIAELGVKQCIYFVVGTIYKRSTLPGRLKFTGVASY